MQENALAAGLTALPRPPKLMGEGSRAPYPRTKDFHPAVDSQQWDSSAIILATGVHYTVQCVSKKNIPDIFSYNSRKHCRIFIIFGTLVTEKVSNQ